ncbi:MAG: peptidoglycan DD-metalloendopeptidase family protein [Rhizobiales bacterium]|nr:peptidoglycan DD-metalloendopeptidase family protein [Hyphomicrobiales bacterium]
MSRHVLSQPYPGVQYRSAPAHRAQPTAAAAPPRTGYTLAHAGRQLRLGPIAFWIVVGTLVIMAAWSIITATYFAFRDDVLTGLVARQAEMQYAYEDRIADLRQQIDRMSSRQLLNQEQYEQKLDQIMRRQSALENRANAIQAMPDSIVTGSTRSTGRGQTRSAPNRPSPVNDRSSDLMTGRDFSSAIARLQASLDRVETRQAASLASMEETYDAKARRIRGVLADLGLDAARVSARGIGGPLVRARMPTNAEAFEHHVQRVSIARAQVDRLTQTLSSVPVRRPLMGEPDISSAFGMRLDPFIRAPAMHTGMDFRGDIGDPARATADGRITIAGWHGGYGKMVEIDHGNGLATRYAHLSDIAVKVGQRVRAGHIVGKVGSTGRSTGAHLHYETRVNGEAVDPRKFLRAGLRLGTGH